MSHIGWGTECSVSQLLGTECSVCQLSHGDVLTAVSLDCWGLNAVSLVQLFGTECSVSLTVVWGLNAVSLTVVGD